MWQPCELLYTCYLLVTCVYPSRGSRIPRTVCTKSPGVLPGGDWVRGRFGIGAFWFGGFLTRHRGILPGSVARSSSDGETIRDVLPVLWMTSCLHILGHMRRQRERAYSQSDSPGTSPNRWRTRIFTSVSLLTALQQLMPNSLSYILSGVSCRRRWPPPTSPALQCYWATSPT